MLGKCSTGLSTEQSEIDERLGDCAPPTTKPPANPNAAVVTTAASETGSDATTAILSVLVGIAALVGLGVLGVYVWRRWSTPLESGNVAALSVFNAAYTRSTVARASSDGELVTEDGSGAVGDGDLYSEQPAAAGTRDGVTVNSTYQMTPILASNDDASAQTYATLPFTFNQADNNAAHDLGFGGSDDYDL